jgi:hypothetical protein
MEKREITKEESEKIKDLYKKAKKLLKFRPKINLNKGLEEVINSED